MHCKIDTVNQICAKVRSCYRVKPGGPKNFLFQVKTITKSPGNGIVECVKSSNLDKKGRIIWFYSLKMISNDPKFNLGQLNAYKLMFAIKSSMEKQIESVLGRLVF